jgi:hypothetical protein
MNSSIISNTMTAKKIIWLLLFAHTYITNVKAQNDFALAITQQFTNYQHNNFREKVFVHTDKTFYLAGERIWFKAYITNTSSHIPVNLSKVVYVELLNAENKPVLQTKIAADKTGEGSLLIPASIATGTYLLRAYTNWMKNFDARYFYTQPVTIVNTIKGISSGFTASHSMQDAGITFYPEGGHLVAGFNSVVGIKAIGKNGFGAACTGTIINEKKEIEARFNTDTYGIGSFSFTPQTQTTYTAIVKYQSDSATIPFTAKLDTRGYVMQLLYNEGDLITVAVKTSADYNNLPVYLFVQSNGIFKTVQTAVIKDGQLFFIINKKDLADGVAHFTLFNNNRQPVCERLYFKTPNNTEVLHLQTEKEIYEPREKVTIDIAANDTISGITDASLSMSVFLIDGLQELNQADIKNYLLFTSGLAEYDKPLLDYLSKKNKNVEQLTNNLMLTQGWSGFKWDDIIKNKEHNFSFLPEMEGLLITGKITHTASGLPAAGITVYLSVPGKAFQYANFVSDTAGRIFFPVKDIFGPADIIVQTDITKDSGYTIEINNPFFEKNNLQLSSTMQLNENIKKQLLNRHIGVQAENTYAADDKKIFASKQGKNNTAFYGQPSHSFKLDAYTRFNTMDEILREITTDVKIRKKDNRNYLRVFNNPKQVYFDTDPLVLLDGVPVFNIEKLVAFSPLKINSVDVVAAKFFTGPIENDGVVSFITYDGDLGGYSLDAGALAIKFDGVQLQRKFYSPEYINDQAKKSRMPDLRNVLMWKPDININKDLRTSCSFYTSDFKGTYAVVVQGLSQNGTPLSSTLLFSVK